MPHFRFRFLSPLVEKSLKFWPVICLVGARQVGKSFFLKQFKNFTYRTLDDPGTNALAIKNPRSILEPPCALDEVQKAPALFDAVKLDVDENRIPGKFILTGSIRFSKRTLIRESLTGRAKTIQLFPLTCAEALELPFENRWNHQKSTQRVSRKEFQKILAKGGMPAIFAARNSSETTSYWKSLVESYVYRDLLFSVPKNPKPALALQILRAVAEILALGEMPIFSTILKKTGGTRTAVERHVVGLEDLMILQRIQHLDASSTKDIFLPFDTALFLSLLNLESPLHDVAVHKACLQIRLVQEFLAVQQVTDLQQSLYYAQSPQGQVVHLITKDKKGAHSFFQIFEEPVPHDYDIRFLKALAKNRGGVSYCLSGVELEQKVEGLTLRPWESML